MITKDKIDANEARHKDQDYKQNENDDTKDPIQYSTRRGSELALKQRHPGHFLPFIYQRVNQLNKTIL